jgi:hypothetical protein
MSVDEKDVSRPRATRQEKASGAPEMSATPTGKKM